MALFISSVIQKISKTSFSENFVDIVFIGIYALLNIAFHLLNNGDELFGVGRVCRIAPRLQRFRSLLR